MARTTTALLALAGAVLVGASSFLPLYGFGSSSYKVFDFDAEPDSLLFLGLEPSFVAVAAAAVGIVALAGGSGRTFGALLMGIGAQTLALFLSYVGWLLFDGDGETTVKVGTLLGLLGGGAILAGGLVSWLSATASETVATTGPPAPAAPSTTPAGWYPDPAGTARLRYWTGAAWSSETHD